MNRNNIKWLAPFIFIFIIGCFYIVVRQSLPLAHHFFGTTTKDCNEALDIASSFGDSAGFINALFSALAFGGVIITFYWQFMVDGKHQKVSLQSQFENVFFNMTNTLQQIITDLSVKSTDHTDIGAELSLYYTASGGGQNNDQGVSQPPIKGRDVFKVWFQLFKRKATDCDDKVQVFEDLMVGSLDHYFRYLYRILLFIDQSELINEEQKYEYAAILRAQLSEYELLILFFNGLTNHGKQKAKPLFEKYSLFNNIRKSELQNLGTIDEYSCGRSQQSDARKYSVAAFEHDYKQDSSLAKFIFKVLFYTTCITSIFVLIHIQWNQYIVDQLLSNIPKNNMPLTLLCVLLTVYVFIQRMCEKKNLNRIMQQKWYGCSDSRSDIRTIPLTNLIDPDYNFVAATTVCTVITISIYSKGDWQWTGSSLYSIPYVYIVCVCSLADFVSCLPHLRWSVINREEFLNQISTFLVPNADTFNLWWDGMRERYDRYIANRTNNSNPQNTIIVDENNQAPTDSSSSAADSIAPTNETIEDTPENIEEQPAGQSGQIESILTEEETQEAVVDNTISDASDEEVEHTS